MEVIGEISRSYQRYRVAKLEEEEAEQKPKPPTSGKHKDDLPTPGEVFFSETLTNVESCFSAIALVGEKFGNPDIAKVGTIGACSANIVANVSSLLGYGALAITPLGAVAAIGMSAVTIYSSLSGKSSKAQQQAEQLQQALINISKQIAHMEDLMVDLFQQSFENDQVILDAISRGFADMQINFDQVNRLLNDITSYLSGMSYENTIGFVSILNDKLRDVLFRTKMLIADRYKKLRETESGKAQLTTLILQNIEGLLSWLQEGSKNPILTGTIHELSSDKNTALIRLNEQRKYPLENTLGFLVNFLQRFYPQPGFNLNPSDVFNISTWSLTASAYASLIQSQEEQGDDVGFSPATEIQALQRQGSQLLYWISQLRSNDRLSEQVFQDYFARLRDIIHISQASYLQTNPLGIDGNNSSIGFKTAIVPAAKDTADQLVAVTNAQQGLLQILAELTGLNTHPEYNWDESERSFSNQTFYRFARAAPVRTAPVVDPIIIRTASFNSAEGGYREMIVSQNKTGDLVISIYKLGDNSWEIEKESVHSNLGNPLQLYDILPHPTSPNKKIFVSTKDLITVALHEYDLTTKSVVPLVQFSPGSLASIGVIGFNNYNYYINGKALQAFAYLDPVSQAPKIAIAYVFHVLTPGTNSPVFYLRTAVYDVNNKYVTHEVNSIPILQHLQQIGQWSMGIASELNVEKVGEQLIFYNRNTVQTAGASYQVFAFNLRTNTYVSLAGVPTMNYSGPANFTMRLQTLTTKEGVEKLYALAHRNNGLELHVYDPNNGWSLLNALDRPSTSYWNGANGTMTVNAIRVLDENCLVLSLCDSGGVYMWLYQPSTNKWYKNNNNPHGPIARGPLWTAQALMNAFIIPDVFSDQDLICFVSPVNGQLQLYQYTLTPVRDEVLQPYKNYQTQWLAQLKDARPQVLHVSVDSIAPDEVKNVELVKDNVIQDGDYTFLSLKTNRQHVQQGLLDLLNAPVTVGDFEVLNNYHGRLGEEIYLIIMAAYFSTASGLSSAKFWSWLGNLRPECENLIVNVWLPAAKAFDDLCNQMLLKHKIFQEGADFTLPYVENETDIRKLSLKQLDALQEQLSAYPDEQEAFIKARKIYQESCDNLTAFCRKDEVCKAYINNGLASDLPLGWRSAELFLFSQQFQPYICAVDEIGGNVVLTQNYTIENPEDIYYLIPDESTDLGFNLFLRVGEDISLDAAAPQYISAHEIALRGSLSVLEQSSVNSVEEHNKELPKARVFTVRQRLRSSPAPEPIKVLSLNDLMKSLQRPPILHRSPA